MDKSILILAVILLSLQFTHSQVQLISLPSISRTTQNRLNAQINLLRLILPTYNWINCNKQLLFNLVSSTSKLLHSATQQMKLGQGNFISGNGIIVGGDGNIIIGNKNLIVGVNNWCFTSEYRTPPNQIDQGILAISNYKITLHFTKEILKDPRQAISELKPEQFQILRNKNPKMSYFFSN